MKGTLLRDFGGADRYLRYDFNAWAAIGDRLGIKIRFASFQDDLLNAPLPLSALRTLIWGGLLHAEPDLTEQQVGAWIDEDNMLDVFQAFFSRFDGTSSPEVQAALRTAMGVPDEAPPRASEPETVLAEAAGAMS